MRDRTGMSLSVKVVRKQPGRDEAEVTSVGRQFQMLAPATGKARRPAVDRRMDGWHCKLISRQS